MKNKKEKTINIFLDFIYLFVGFSCLLVSIYYSWRWFKYNGVIKYVREILAISYMLFLNILFESSIALFIKSKKYRIESKKMVNKNIKNLLIEMFIKKKIIAILLIFVWLFLTSYSIISTIGGQYDQLSKIETQLPEDTSDYKDQIKLIEDKINLYEKRIKSNKIEKQIILKRLSSVEDVDKNYTYKNTTRKNEIRLDKLKETIDNDESEILKLKDNIISIKLKGSKINSGSIYNYFEKIIHIKGYVIQFVLSFFPSIVVDFFAPISFAMFIFGRKKDKKN